ncbi:MAG TPA: GIY-YIG nuclease family protein [Gemmatimonadaceae bacterium]|jgi:putative endonuclease
MRRTYYIYILASLNKTLYTGCSSALIKRLVAHRTGVGSKFVARYRIERLVYYEMTDDAYAAVTRERQIKSWRREKKIALIERFNPDWRDLAIDWLNPGRRKR